MWPLILSCRNYATLKFTWEACFQYDLLDRILRPILNDCISNLCIIELTLVRNIGVNQVWEIKLCCVFGIEQNILVTRLYLCLIIEITIRSPNKLGNKVARKEYLITDFLQMHDFFIIDGNKNNTIRC